jgi:hypothetical protein
MRAKRPKWAVLLAVCMTTVMGISACTSTPPALRPNTVWSPKKNTVFIDFRQCTPGGLIEDVGMGTTHVEMVQKKLKACVMRYGNDLEDPQGNGPRMYTCKVSVSLGVQRFSVTDFGIDTSPVDRYCAS